jgi:hypothetical protein
VQRSAAFLLASLAGIAQVRADRSSIHGTASVDAAVTDNVLSAPLGADREGDVLLTIRPGMLFTYAYPRWMNELNAELELTRYVGQSDSPTIAARGAWKSIILKSPLSEIILDANINRSVVSAIGAATVPQNTSVALLPINQVTALEGGFSEYASKTLTRELRMYQSAFARAGKSDDDGMPRTIVKSAEVGMAWGLDRSWKRDAISVEFGASVLRLDRNPEAPMGGRHDRQINPRGRATWRHDLSRKLSTSLDAGMVVVVPYGEDPYHPGEERSVGNFPLVGAQMAYTDVWGVTTAAVRRDVTPNLFVAANTVNDTASLAVAVPLYWLENNRRAQPKLAGVGSFGIQRTQLIEPETSDLTSSFIVARADAGIQYAPKPGFTYSLRYEMMYQTSDRGSGISDPQPGFLRNTVYLSASVRFPADVAVRVPKRRTNSVRADRKDLAPFGAEPVIPDLTEGGGEL